MRCRWRFRIHCGSFTRRATLSQRPALLQAADCAAPMHTAGCAPAALCCSSGHEGSSDHEGSGPVGGGSAGSRTVAASAATDKRRQEQPLRGIPRAASAAAAAASGGKAASPSPLRLASAVPARSSPGNSPARPPLSPIRPALRQGSRRCRVPVCLSPRGVAKLTSVAARRRSAAPQPGSQGCSRNAGEAYPVLRPPPSAAAPSPRTSQDGANASGSVHGPLIIPDNALNSVPLPDVAEAAASLLRGSRGRLSLLNLCEGVSPTEPAVEGSPRPSEHARALLKHESAAADVKRARHNHGSAAPSPGQAASAAGSNDCGRVSTPRLTPSKRLRGDNDVSACASDAAGSCAGSMSAPRRRPPPPPQLWQDKDPAAAPPSSAVGTAAGPLTSSEHVEAELQRRLAAQSRAPVQPAVRMPLGAPTAMRLAAAAFPGPSPPAAHPGRVLLPSAGNIRRALWPAADPAPALDRFARQPRLSADTLEALAACVGGGQRTAVCVQPSRRPSF